MAKSQYEYVKTFELDDSCMPHTWMVCRIDGVGFTKFTAAHQLTKPNDDRARDLMNAAARAVLTAYPDVCIAYGVSDEYSFVLQPLSTLYSRRVSKISSAIVSLFTSAYVHGWSSFFPDSPLQLDNLPFFDSRIVCYPTDAILKDYLRWRQVDAHINNLYNTCFWKVVRRYQRAQPELSEKQARDLAHADMNSKYASSAQKNDLLHDEFGVNYNDELAAYRKGSILVWREDAAAESHASAASSSPAAAAAASASHSLAAASSASASAPAPSSSSASAHSASLSASLRVTRSIALLHCDLIQDSFYTDEYPGIVPYLSWADLKKSKKAAEKLEKKAAHKSREKAEKAAGAVASSPPRASLALVAATSEPASDALR